MDRLTFVRLLGHQREAPEELERSLYEQYARVARAIGSPGRVALLDVLCQGERGVEDLATAVSMGLKNASAQLKELRLARLVEARREGTHVYYRVADESVCAFLADLRHLARGRLAEVDRMVSEWLEPQGGPEPVRRTDLLARMASGEVVVFDVRPRVEYSAGHIPGARSVPLEEVEVGLAALPPEVEVVAYCRGPYCVLAPEAVRACLARGIPARRLEDGFPEWRRAGLPVARGFEEAA